MRRGSGPAPLPVRDGLGPLPVRDGLGPARLRLHGGNVLAEFSRRFGSGAKVLNGEVVDRDGAVVDATTVLAPGAHVFLYRDDNIVVVDKPHFLATMPRGAHVVQTALVRLRRDLGLSELSPAHRLDRLTAGVLMFTARRAVRGAYQNLFARGEVTKTYLAVSSVSPDLVAPLVILNRIVKQRGILQARIEPGEPNAETRIEPLGAGRYRLTPRTGRTHQLRLHMAALGVGIDNDPLYPNIIDVDPGDFTAPLHLIAHRLEFDDPITGARRCFVSSRS